MPVLFQKIIKREDLWSNPKCIYLFGDNLVEAGLGGQAKEMRGEPNALGIPTKSSPYQYLSDDDYDLLEITYQQKFNLIKAHLQLGRTVIIPIDGLGTGLAKLEEKAPKIYKLLCEKLREIT